jgi:chemotaxis protein MotB
MSELDKTADETQATADAAPAEVPEPVVRPVRTAAPMEEEDAEPECPPCKSGAPGWMATFADMATLLMAFFVLILSFSDTEIPKFEQINGSIQAAFGIRKVIPTIKIPSARSLVVETFTPAIAQRTVVNQQAQLGQDINAENLVVRDNESSADFEIEQELRRVQAALADAIESGEIEVRVDDNDIVVEISANSSASPSGRSTDSAKAGQVNQRLIELSAAVANAQTQVTRELQVFSVSRTEQQNQPNTASQTEGSQPSQAPSRADLQEQLNRVRADLNTELAQGLVEVELVNNAIVIRLASQSSFVSGSADLRPDFLPLLAQVGRTIASSQGVVRVEGHTDNVPVVFSDRFNSNWDLSAVRAASVADFLAQSANIPAQRLSVKGFADTVPLESNATADGRGRNRRIEIIVDGN